MKFNTFLNCLNSLKQQQLGGRSSQFKLAPALRIKFSEEKIETLNPRSAAVLALFYPDKEQNTRFLLTKRASYNGAHSAQISFPGGKLEKKDINLQETAIRETFEEVGVNPTLIITIKELTNTYIPPSNFWVTPFLAYSTHTPKFVINEEVNTLIEVPLENLLNDNYVSSIVLDTSYMKQIEVPCFKFQEHIVWGATAMILSEIKDLIKEIE